MHRYIFFRQGEKGDYRKENEKKDRCELANFDENFAIRQNYASFET